MIFDRFRSVMMNHCKITYFNLYSSHYLYLKFIYWSQKACFAYTTPQMIHHEKSMIY